MTLMNKFEKIINLLKCLECENDLIIIKEGFKCEKCGKNYPVLDGIPRFVPEKFWKLNNENTNLNEKTKNYFGFEWEYFNNWGFIDEKSLTAEERTMFNGGTAISRKDNFDKKCRLLKEDLTEGKIILDAGCGNGRYTYEAAIRGGALVIGVDLGFGSVQSAYKNTGNLNNVIIIQGDLFNLPFKDWVFDSCFSNGVLMHTGNAEKAFNSVAKTIKKEGIFVAHVYNKLNPVWEFNDFIIRKITTKLSISANLKFANFLAYIGKKIWNYPKIYKFVNLFMRIQGHPILMYDWYAAPVASHHTYQELADWYIKNNFKILDKVPKRGLIQQVWGINLKGLK